MAYLNMPILELNFDKPSYINSFWLGALGVLNLHFKSPFRFLLLSSIVFMTQRGYFRNSKYLFCKRSSVLVLVHGTNLGSVFFHSRVDFLN